MPSITPFDWSARYRSGDTPWDHGCAHPELAARLESGELTPPTPSRSRALVPGCGPGHDALALARAGWRVTAVDFAQEVAGRADQLLAEHGGEFVLGDALALDVERPFELIFEHTFLCAIPLEDRARWGALARRALAPGGRLAALVFPVGKDRASGGPPWGIEAAEIAALLGSGFRLAVDVPASARIPSRQWPERWALFERAP